MANMSYCRFENTYRDMIDCYHNLNNKLSDNENKYRKKLVELCQDILDEFDEDISNKDRKEEE
jgi:hypothetical protein